LPSFVGLANIRSPRVAWAVCPSACFGVAQNTKKREAIKAASPFSLINHPQLATSLVLGGLTGSLGFECPLAANAHLDLLGFGFGLLG
jgi:hypothetical protein